MTRVYMTQVSPQLWQLLSENKSVVVDNIACYSVIEAEDWAVRYVSSFPAWMLVIKPLVKDEK